MKLVIIGMFNFYEYCIVLLLHLRYCRQNAEGNYSSGPKHHEDQDHRSTREKVLRMDRWLHPRLSIHLPADVDLQAGIRRVRTIHCAQEVLLSACVQPETMIYYSHYACASMRTLL